MNKRSILPVVLGVVSFLAIAPLFPSRAAISEWDASFDTDGLVINDVGAGMPDMAYAVAYQDDGKILQLGRFQEAGDASFNI